MKIAFITAELPPEIIGGIGSYVRVASKALTAHGHHVEIFTATRGTSASVLEDGVLVHRIHCPSHKEFHRAVVASFVERHASIHFDVYEAPELFNQSSGIRSRLPEVPCLVRVHSPTFIAHELNERAYTPAGRWLQFLRFFLSCIVRGKTPAPAWRFGAQMLWARSPYLPHDDPERDAALKADLVAIPSTIMRRRLHDAWGLNGGQDLFLPNLYPVSPELLAIERPPEGRHVLFLGRMIAFKGVFTLATALRLTRRQYDDFECTFAGESGLSPRTSLNLRNVLRGTVIGYEDTYSLLRSQLGESVNFAGGYDPMSLPTLLSGADICVLPSWWDNFPAACLEAMAAGRAIIATNSGGMSDMLDNGKCGVLIEPKNPRALASALLDLLKNQARRVELGQRARARVRSVYAEQSLVPSYEAAYAKCIRRHDMERHESPRL
jgi:glycosyltransferase involved in cell wall biosynthesis